MFTWVSSFFPTTTSNQQSTPSIPTNYLDDGVSDWLLIDGNEDPYLLKAVDEAESECGSEFSTPVLISNHSNSLIINRKNKNHLNLIKNNKLHPLIAKMKDEEQKKKKLGKLNKKNIGKGAFSIINMIFGQNPYLLSTLRPTLNYTKLQLLNRNYLADAKGPVILLMPHTRGNKAENSNDLEEESPETANADNAVFYQNLHSSWGAQNNININWRVVPADMDYEEYINQVNEACSESQRDMFDIIWVDAIRAGQLSDCLVDFWEFDSTIGDFHDQNILQNGIVKERLVTLPAENNFGVLFSNKDILSKFEIDKYPTNLDEFEKIFFSVLEQEKSSDIFNRFGLVTSLTGEGLVCAAVEWLAAADKSSVINLQGNVTVSTSDIGNILIKVKHWIDSQIINPNDVGTTTDETALQKWLNQQSIYLRHWSSTILDEAKTADFEWDVSPLFTTNSSQHVGTFNGWALGVYKYSSNIKAAVKTVKWMTSKKYQKDVITKAPQKPIIATYPELFYDPEVCNVYTDRICSVFRKVQVVLRPSSITKQYSLVSLKISNSISSILSGEVNVVTALVELDRDLRSLLGLQQSNSSAPIVTEVPSGPSKKVPKNMGSQLLILLAVFGVFITGVLIFRRINIKKKNDKKNLQMTMVSTEMCKNDDFYNEEKYDEEKLGMGMVIKSSIP